MESLDLPVLGRHFLKGVVWLRALGMLLQFWLSGGFLSVGLSVFLHWLVCFLDDALFGVGTSQNGGLDWLLLLRCLFRPTSAFGVIRFAFRVFRDAGFVVPALRACRPSSFPLLAWLLPALLLALFPALFLALALGFILLRGSFLLFLSASSVIDSLLWALSSG